ncbi:MAG: signal peptidase I [Eubacterium sp.]|jgi:signal peptidase I|nr:signal peptidase I [Eubacterium sp.]
MGNSDNLNHISARKSKKIFLYDIYEWVESLFLPLIFIVLLMTFTARISKVDGGSMLPTLHNNDYLVIGNIFYKPVYNDIIVLQASNLHNERFESGKPIVKRVVGLPGDRIFVDTEGGFVYRNGEMLDIEEKNGIIFEDGHMINDYSRSGEIREEITVPKNSVFVMGDNRMNSLDSRFSSVGMIDENYIVGKVVLRILPFENFGSLYENKS